MNKELYREICYIYKLIEILEIDDKTKNKIHKSINDLIKAHKSINDLIEALKGL